MADIIIPDLHHDLPWLERILDAEQPTTDDCLVFLGDYFDAFHPEASAKRVCRRMAELFDHSIAGIGPKTTWLLGNHDLQYLVLARRHRHNPTGIPRHNFEVPYGCSGYSKSRAQDIIRYADPVWLDALQLIAMKQGFLCSHAGVLPSFVKVQPLDMLEPQSVDHQHERIYRQLESDAAEALASCHIEPSPWFWCGRSRGGSDPYSGPLWLDWRGFDDNMPWPQLVGHTGGKVARQQGRSWCLDTNQSAYAAIEDGILSIRHVERMMTPG